MNNEIKRIQHNLQQAQSQYQNESMPGSLVNANGPENKNRETEMQQEIVKSDDEDSKMHDKNTEKINQNQNFDQSESSYKMTKDDNQDFYSNQLNSILKGSFAPIPDNIDFHNKNPALNLDTDYLIQEDNFNQSTQPQRDIETNFQSLRSAAKDELIQSPEFKFQEVDNQSEEGEGECRRFSAADNEE